METQSLIPNAEIKQEPDYETARNMETQSLIQNIKQEPDYETATNMETQTLITSGELKHEPDYEVQTGKKEINGKEESYMFLVMKRSSTSSPSLSCPDEDSFLYCEKCQLKYEGGCPEHGPVICVDNAEEGQDEGYCQDSSPLVKVVDNKDRQVLGSEKEEQSKVCEAHSDDVLELSSLVPDKESSVAFLQQHGILHNSRHCNNNHVMKLSLTDRQDRWRCFKCRLDIPLRDGTWLQGSRLPYRDIILFIYYWSQEMTSLSFCQLQLGMNKSTTVLWSNYLREVCANKLLSNPVILGGPNTTVEIDESLFTRRKNHVGHVFPQQWVFGGICRDTGDCFMFSVPDRTAVTLLPIIQTYIRPGTTVISDLWRAYGGIDNIPGLTHLTVNHSINFVDPTTGAHMQCIEHMWRSAKESNKRRMGTHTHMLDSYLCEFMWRRRIKCANPDVFNAILSDIVVLWPPQ